MIGLYTRICRIIFRAWPFEYGFERLESWIRPPVVRGKRQGKLSVCPARVTYDPSTYIGRRIYYRGMFEEHIARVIQSELKEGQTFIDVGANIGVHTLTASYAAGSTGRVVAYEPQSDLLDSLRNDLASNSLSNVTLVGAALGEHQTRLKLYVPHLQNPGLAVIAKDVVHSAAGRREAGGR